MIGKIKEQGHFKVLKEQRDALCRARDLIHAVSAGNEKEYRLAMGYDPALEYDIVEYVRARMVLAGFDSHWEENPEEEKAG